RIDSPVQRAVVDGFRPPRRRKSLATSEPDIYDFSNRRPHLADLRTIIGRRLGPAAAQANCGDAVYLAHDRAPAADCYPAAMPAAGSWHPDGKVVAQSPKDRYRTNERSRCFPA